VKGEEGGRKKVREEEWERQGRKER